jgi:hypothetical protein
MVNLPHRSSESLMREAISRRAEAIQRTAGAIALTLLAALLIGAILQQQPPKSDALHDLLPLDDPAVSWLFTA